MTLLRKNKTFFILTLISVLTLNGFLISNSASAQQPTTPLQPTQVVATIPQTYNETFSLQWGGGSLYQLKQRLATMSCIVDTIWVYDNNRWYSYNQYQVPSTLTPNIEFQNNYAQYIPAGTLYASCYDICDFNYYDSPRGNNPCISMEQRREQNFGGILPYPIDDSNPCTTNFDSRVQTNVLPSMPIYPDTCIIRQQAPRIRAIVSGPITGVPNALYPYYPPYIVVYENTPLTEQGTVRLFNSEIHELCHTNQHWHFIENLQPDNTRTASEFSPTAIWLTTQAGREFINLVGFTQNSNGEWTLPDNTYQGIYGITEPDELAAELCVMYFIDQTREQSKYNNRIYDPDTGYQWRDAPIEFNSSPYLTPAIRQWIETYIVLPS